MAASIFGGFLNSSSSHLKSQKFNFNKPAEVTESPPATRKERIRNIDQKLKEDLSILVESIDAQTKELESTTEENVMLRDQNASLKRKLQEVTKEKEELEAKVRRFVVDFQGKEKDKQSEM